MAWTAPTTRTTGELITAAIWNTDLVDNLDALKDPPTDHYELNEVADYTTTSTSFVDVDATNLALTITTTGGDILVTGVFSVKHSLNSGQIFLNLDLDGSVVAANDGLACTDQQSVASSPGWVHNVPICYWITGVAAGSHTVKLQWKVNAGTATLYAGAGTATKDVHNQFAIREAT